MTAANMKKASQDELRRMREAGELHHDTAAPERDDLGPEFWAGAKLQGPKRLRSVHLKLEPEVFEFFVKETGGKGHLTRMQAVLRAYVAAMKG